MPVQKFQASWHRKPLLCGLCLLFLSFFLPLTNLHIGHRPSTSASSSPPSWCCFIPLCFFSGCLLLPLCLRIPILSFSSEQVLVFKTQLLPSHKCPYIFPVLLLSTEMRSCFLLYTQCLALCLTHRMHLIKVNWINVWRDEQIHEYYGLCCLASFSFILPSNSDGVTSCWDAHSWWWQNLLLCV